MSLSTRIEEAEEATGVTGTGSAFDLLRGAGISRKRAGRLVTADDRIRWDAMTAEEENAVADRLLPGRSSWDELTDEQLERIVEGEDMRTVVDAEAE